ncbi:hypothetical protein Tco_0004374 [Tanacetum coccineum]
MEMLVGLSNHWVKLMRLVIWVKSTNNCFGGMMLIFGLLEALDMEALVDVMDIDSGGLSFKESFIGLFGSIRHLVTRLVYGSVESDQGVKVGMVGVGGTLHEKFHHHHHHIIHVDEMTCLDVEKIEKIRKECLCHDHYQKVAEFVSRARWDAY